MAITHVGHSGAYSSSCALPAGSAEGDLAICLSQRNSSSANTLLGDWTNLGVQVGLGASACYIRLAYKVLTAADITDGTSGTWGSTNTIRVSVYRGAGTPAGFLSSGSSSSTTTLTLPAQSGLASGTWQVAVGCSRDSSSGINVLSIADYTTRSSGQPDITGFWDSNGSTTGIAQKTPTLSGTGSGVAGATIYIPEAAATAPTISSVTLSGTSQIGNTLTANVVTDPASGPTIAYRWQTASDGSGTGAADISGETASTLALTYADFGSLLDTGAYTRVGAIATDGNGSSDESFSAWQEVTAPSGSGVVVRIDQPVFIM